MKLTRYTLAMIAMGLLLFAGSAKAIILGQIDDFEDGTLQNWANGGEVGAPPVLNIDTGGPAGVGDNFMEVAAVGSGPGQFLTVFNRSQWLGNYLATGVTAIEMDLRNLGKVDLTIRLGFKDAAEPGASGYVSQGFTLAPGGDWQHVIFLINPATMTAVGSPDAFNTFFADGIQETRIINEMGTDSLNGDAVTGQLGVDNIHAVPEPSAIGTRRSRAARIHRSSPGDSSPAMLRWKVPIRLGRATSRRSEPLPTHAACPSN